MKSWLRLDKELNKIEDEISMVENKLNNSQFIENAPKDVIDKQRKNETRPIRTEGPNNYDSR